MIPSNIKEFAKRKGATATINKIARWLDKMGMHISGGTAIGKYYDTIVLDVTYQGSNIYVHTNDDTIHIDNNQVNSFDEFRVALTNNLARHNGGGLGLT